MRYTTGSTFAFFLATTVVNGLTITSPAAGSIVDPGKPITITWTSDASDPSTINLSINSPSALTFSGAQVASNVQTSSGSYVVPANTLTGYGNGYTVTAESTSGNTLASSNNILLQYGTNTDVTTEANGQLSLVSVATDTAAAAAAAATSSDSSLTSIIFSTSGVEGQSVTATALPGTDTSAAVTSGATTVTGSPSSESSSATTDAETSSRSSSSGIINSTSSRSTSSSTRNSSTTGSTSTSTSSAGAATRTLGAGAGAVGFVAGLFAVIV